MQDDIEEVEEVEDIELAPNIVNHGIVYRQLVQNKTSNNISLTEMITTIMHRADAIESGSPIFITTSETSAWKIAALEIVQKKCPLSVVRKLGTAENIEYTEIYNVNDLILTQKCLSNISDIISSKEEAFNIKEKLYELIGETSK